MQAYSHIKAKQAVDELIALQSGTLGYNVRFLHYPSGWQVRIYDSKVGVNFNIPKSVDDSVGFPFWDENLQDYQQGYISEKRYLKEGTWMNPFTGIEELAPHFLDEEDESAKKERSVRSSRNRTVNKVYHIARSNTWDWFVTLTFNPEKVDSFDYEACVKKLSVWLMHCRRSAPDLGYIMVPEKHPTSGRFHFHGLFRDADGLGFKDSGHVDKSGNRIYNIGSYKLGFTTATRVGDQARVTRYIAKYISKDVCEVAFREKEILDVPEPVRRLLAGGHARRPSAPSAPREAQGVRIPYPPFGDVGGFGGIL